MGLNPVFDAAVERLHAKNHEAHQSGAVDPCPPSDIVGEISDADLDGFSQGDLEALLNMLDQERADVVNKARRVRAVLDRKLASGRIVDRIGPMAKFLAGLSSEDRDRVIREAAAMQDRREAANRTGQEAEPNPDEQAPADRVLNEGPDEQIIRAGTLPPLGGETSDVGIR